MSTNTLVAAVAGAATTVAVLLTIGVAPNVAAPVGLLIGGITALVLFVNSPAAVPAVPIASAPAKKSKKAAKKEAVKRAPTPPPADDDSNSDASASEVSEDDAEETTQSKNAKKKAKKKQKEAEAKAAAAAAAKKAEEEKKKAAKKTAAPAPAPTPAAPVAKKDEGKKASKKNKEEKKAAAAPVPAPRTPSPPPQVEEEEEEFQTSKASKKKAKQDAKKAEKKEVDVPTPAPKKATPAPAPVAAVSSPVAAAPAPKKAEKKAAAPAPVVAAEEDGWETAKAAKPTIAQKQALKVANAEKKVEENTINTASDVYSEFVDIPARAVPAIIGSKGAVLKALQEGTQAKIEIPPASTRALDSLTVRVIVSGEPDAVRFAKTCVKSLAEKGFSAVTHPGFVSDDIYVESKQHGFIIGPKGTTLKTIQTKSGTRIQMPERGGNDRVLIVGPKEGVKAAKEAIKQLIADGFSSMTHEGTEKKEIEFPREKIGWLIGANGQTIKSIQGNTKCKINIPRDNSNVIVIVGPADKIAQAEKEILNTLKPNVKKGKKADDNEEEEEEIDTEEKEVEAEQADAPQGNYNAWPSEEATATTEDQLWS